MGLVVTSKEMIKFLESKGFKIRKVKGSHHKMSDGNNTTVVPLHKEDLKDGTLRGILKQSGISLKELEKWLGR